MPVAKSVKRSARKNKKKTPVKKHVGDVLGLGPAKPPRKTVKSAGKRPKGIEITPRKRSRTPLRPARVRG
jgi:hypothetical protein